VHLSAGGQETLVRRYYSVAGQRVLLDGTDTYYLLTDHLGSVVAVADSEGDLVSEQRYLPYGEGRFTPGITETDFGFTGQRNLAAVGLMDYHARWYRAGFGRFVSADSIILAIMNPRFLNRHAYVSNNPLRFTDPSGYYLCEDLGSCEPPLDGVYKPPTGVSFPDPDIPPPDDIDPLDQVANMIYLEGGTYDQAAANILQSLFNRMYYAINGNPVYNEKWIGIHAYGISWNRLTQKQVSQLLIFFAGEEDKPGDPVYDGWAYVPTLDSQTKIDQWTTIREAVQSFVALGPVPFPGSVSVGITSSVSAVQDVEVRCYMSRSYSIDRIVDGMMMYRHVDNVDGRFQYFMDPAQFLVFRDHYPE
jgi:RHS repeat-associated protein